MTFVLFGNASEKNAAIRYRLLAFAKRLEQDGHTCIVNLLSSAALDEALHDRRNLALKLLYFIVVKWRRMLQLASVIGADAVFFRGPLYPYGPPVFERIVHLLNPRIVFDIDDAIWEPPAHVSSLFLRVVDFGWVRKMSRMAAHAIVGNEYLADYVRPLNPNVTVIPTCLDVERYQKKLYGAATSTAPDTPVRLGWVGLRDNLGYLKIIEPVLRDLAAKHAIVLDIASNGAYELEGVRVENHEWRVEEEIQYLRNVDIGLMPLHDTPRARGKCAFKALQYMAVEAPVVISPVGMNARLIGDGENGFLAATPQEWHDKLERLIMDAALRQRIGAAGRRTIQADYTFDVHYPRFRQVLESVAQRKRDEAV